MTMTMCKAFHPTSISLTRQWLSWPTNSNLTTQGSRVFPEYVSRTMRILICLITIAAFLTSMPTGELKAQTENKMKDVNQTAQSLELKNDRGSLEYWLFLPKGYDASDQTKPWPLMIFLHGHGERGDNLNKVKLWGPPKGPKKNPISLLSWCRHSYLTNTTAGRSVNWNNWSNIRSNR